MNERIPDVEEHRELRGTIEAVRHHNPDDGWTVARLRVADGESGSGSVVAVVGNISNAREGMAVKVWGEWVTHPQYGEQFRFHRYEIAKPLTAEAMKRFLAGGSIKGIGPATAELLVARFGNDTMAALSNPEQLREIPGIGRKRAEAIAAEWKRQQESGGQEALMRLQGMGISAAHAIRIHKHYGDQAVEVVEQNPYQLALEVEGIGFKTADRIAQVIGVPKGSPFRLQAGIAYALQEAAAQGHCFMPRDRLLEYAGKLLESEDEEGLEDACRALVDREWVVVEDAPELRLMGGPEGGEPRKAVYLPRLHRAEHEVARHLRRLQHSAAQAKATAESLDAWLNGDRRVGETELSLQQAEAVRLALTEKVLVLTGGPGVGKTTVTRAMVDIFQNSGCVVALASPTGRAAKKLSEMTGRPAKTIHRLLEIDPTAWQFRRNDQHPLEADVVIVDEASMLDIELMHALVRAIPDQARLILVGDVDQLPSVGPGLVLRDLIESKATPVARLSEIFRQDRESQIVMNAYRVNEGRPPEFHTPPKPDDDCVFISENLPEAVVQKVAQLVGEELPHDGFEAADIQVLTPMNKRNLGTVQLNQVLQEALNPPRADKPEVQRGEKVIREGDRVLQTVNNYTKEVFNGDVGTVLAIHPADNKLVVQFLEQSAWYSYDELDELELAYAMTVHKAQGSEYPAVVLICHTSQYIMLQRNLLYTGLTRAKRKCVFVGNRPAIWTAVRNNKPARRYTRLKQLLAAG